jgi:NADH:ubiquinone oxidoreductase subunit 2 (subunit N)
MVQTPVRLAPFALVVALIAVAIGGRHARLASIAVAVAALGWLVGMIVAISTENPIY